jgi:hypothetical protein
VRSDLPLEVVRNIAAKKGINMLSAIGFRGCIFVCQGIQVPLPINPDMEHIAAPAVMRLIRAFPLLLRIDDFWPD